MGRLSKEQLQNTALSQAGDATLSSGQSYLEGSAASGKQGCMLGNPGLASPAGTRGGSWRHPNGDAEPEEGLDSTAGEMETRPQHVLACRARHPAETRGAPQVWGSGRVVLPKLTRIILKATLPHPQILGVGRERER